MATLSEVASETKTLTKWGAIVLGALLCLFIFFKLGGAIKNIIFPPKPKPPTVGFGKIQKPAFPPDKSDRTFNYIIDTTTGTLPKFPDRIKVFKMAEEEGNLLGLQKAQEKMSRAGFHGTPTAESKEIYKWNDNSKILKNISYNIVTDDFTLSSSYFLDPNVLEGKNLTDIESAIAASQDFLTLMGAFQKDIDVEKTKANLFAIKNYVLVPASSISTSQVIQVSFFQKDIEKTPIFYPDPKISNLNVSIASGDNSIQIVEAKSYYQEISEESETYPVKTAEEALEDLRIGKGFIASYEGEVDETMIKNVFLAYYIGNEKQEYLMPIIVFEGNNNFYAYVSAVKDEWLNN